MTFIVLPGKFLWLPPNDPKSAVAAGGPPQRQARPHRLLPLRLACLCEYGNFSLETISKPILHDLEVVARLKVEPELL